MRSRGVVFAVFVAIAVSACGTGSGRSDEARSTAGIVSCLKAAGISAETLHLPGTAGITQRGLAALVMISQPNAGAEVAVYRTPADAAKTFSAHEADAPELIEGNAILAITGLPTANTLSPPSALIERIEPCAFGHRADPKRSSLYVEAYVHGNDGYAVVLQSGCLGCHMIGADGNNGPGPNLTGIGRRLTAAKIAHVLRDPVAPMPSFGGLERSDPRGWQALISYLSHLGTR